MTIDALLAKIDTQRIYPPFLAMYRAVLDDCTREGADYPATCGIRWPSDQLTEYLKGRETPGPNATPERPLGDTVTRARPYGSFHQFGIAIDATRDKDARPGLQPSWDRADYALLATSAAKRGLRSLGPTQQDWPHVELPIETRGLSLVLLRNEMKSARDPQEGLRRAWALLDKHGPWVLHG